MAEILAPVGNFDMLVAAVVNGADAVYLGLGKFNARAKAVGFCGEELRKAVEYAHLFGTRVFAAINTLIKDDEIGDAIEAVQEGIDCKVDAFIVQDLGFATLLRRKFPSIVLHASTQMGIHNLEGANVAKKLGFSRVILSRETLFEDIKKIKENVDIEVECFVQGALCICFSGNCYFSSLASGYSGNRGKCMQLCRKRYSASIGDEYKRYSASIGDEYKRYSASVGGETVEGFLLSAKDLNLSQKLKKLTEIGVDCFKIEGRLRRPEYVAESVRVYKKALTREVDQADLDALKRVFNRGDYTEGHLFQPTNRVLDIKLASHKGLKIGKVLSVSGKSATLSSPLNKGDGVKFLRGGYEVGSASITSDGVKTGFVGNVKSGDDVYITTDVKFNEAVLSRTKKLAAAVRLDFENSLLTLVCGIFQAELPIVGAQPALSQPITKEELITCFNKNEYFTVVNAEVVGRAFMQKSALNALRRAAYEALKVDILGFYNGIMQKFEDNYLTMCDIISEKSFELTKFDTIYQIESVADIINDMGLFVVNPREYSVSALMEFKPYFDRALLNLPCILRGKDIDVIKEIIEKCSFKGYVVNNLCEFELVKGAPILLGYGLNIINDLIDAPKVYSFENDQVKSDGYTYYGNVPLMNFCHCEKKELKNGCENCKGYDITLSYEGRKFYLRRYKVGYCYSQLLNCADLVPIGNPKKKFIDYSFRRTELSTKGNYIRGLK